MVLRLALLVCDTPIPTVVEAHGEYPEIYDTWLKASNVAGVPYKLTPFDVVNHPEVYPKPEEFDAIVLTGSAASAYSPLPWIQTLTRYIHDLASSHPRVKIVGICFGHQIVAQALGGQVVPNDGLWEIGVSQVGLTKAGMDVFGEDGEEFIDIQQMHRDHVPNLPPNFTLLGSTTVCPVQGMVQIYGTNHGGSSERIDPSSIHILTVQGHPEFTASIVEKMVDMRAGRGVFSRAVAEKASLDAVKAHDGTGRIGTAIWKVLASGQGNEQTKCSN